MKRAKRHLFFLWVISLWAISPLLFAQRAVVDSSSQGGLESMTLLAEKMMNCLTFEKGCHSVFVFPVAGYSPVSGLEIGMMPVWRIKPDVQTSKLFYRPSIITQTIIFSTRGLFEVDLDMETFTSSQWTSKLETQFVFLPDRFYGIGNQDADLKPVKFNAYRYRLEGHLMKGWRDRFFCGMSLDAGFYRNREREGTMVSSDVTGYKGGWSNALGPLFVYDSRNDPNWPTRGTYLKFTSLFAGSFMASDFSFNQFSFDGRWFVTPFNEKGIIASQLFVKNGWGDIPFYKLPALGGKNALRGIPHPLKYSNSNVWFAQSEYRRHIWWRFSCVAFAGIGASFGKFDNVVSQCHYTAGAGLRIQVLPGENLHLRVDYGIANGGDKAFYVGLREVF